ncbi:hypothetical protein B7R70_00875 [Yersinia pseudotuberculosis]|nr:hypothetical protein CEQ20_16290 [Yersinia pseudotuberculosis]AYX10450.1 hypothetical protein EGX52_06350 [Yersinia pseudotuberculosis]AYX15949.1 hypothetical protein EGX44_12580 [Yersinia pseudotuberculosis]PEI14355.1 hypothetical protein CRM78_14710 [Yersinia pseudotuberculosis]PST81524.1 hypothetical protein B7R70_00875 [Yersinia pseudotuberculosis]
MIITAKYIAVLSQHLPKLQPNTGYPFRFFCVIIARFVLAVSFFWCCKVYLFIAHGTYVFKKSRQLYSKSLALQVGSQRANPDESTYFKVNDQ